MFERYNTKARRAIFYARKEATELGWEVIEADFVLLGVARENPELCIRWLGANYAELRQHIAQLYPSDKRVPESMDLPLSHDCERVLAHAKEEADRLAHRDISTEHLLLGLLYNGGAALKFLEECGNEVASLRVAIAGFPER